MKPTLTWGLGFLLFASWIDNYNFGPLATEESLTGGQGKKSLPTVTMYLCNILYTCELLCSLKNTPVCIKYQQPHSPLRVIC